MSKKTVDIAGISTTITRKNSLKHLYIKICPPDGAVEVVAPAKVDDEQIHYYILGKLADIKRHQEKFISQERQDVREYVSGEAYYLWGRPLCLRVVENDARFSNVTRTRGKLVLNVPRGTDEDFRKRKINDWYRGELKRAVEITVPKLEQKVGVKANEYCIKNMKTRWGTCNVDARRVWLNLQLVKKPPECLDYIIVHELCHLLEKNHSHRFWALVEKFCPNWEDAKKTLDSMPLDYI